MGLGYTSLLVAYLPCDMPVVGFFRCPSALLSLSLSLCVCVCVCVCVSPSLALSRLSLPLTVSITGVGATTILLVTQFAPPILRRAPFPPHRESRLRTDPSWAAFAQARLDSLGGRGEGKGGREGENYPVSLCKLLFPRSLSLLWFRGLLLLLVLLLSLRRFFSYRLLATLLLLPPGRVRGCGWVREKRKWLGNRCFELP